MPRRKSLKVRVSDSFRVIKDLDLSHEYERQAGTATLAIVIIGVLAAAWAGGRWMRSDAPMSLIADFDEARGLTAGDPVVVAGVRVGQVRHLGLADDGRVRVTLRVPRAQRPRRDASAEIVSLNLVGDVAVSYRRGVDTAFLPDGQPVVGRAPADLAHGLADVGERVESVGLEARAFLRDDLRRELAEARVATARAQAAVGRATRRATDGLREALDQSDALLASFDSLVAAVPRDSAKADLAALRANLDTALTALGDIRGRMAAMRARADSGQGNIGRATQDQALARELDATVQAYDLLLWKYLRKRPPERRPFVRPAGDSR